MPTGLTVGAPFAMIARYLYSNDVVIKRFSLVFVTVCNWPPVYLWLDQVSRQVMRPFEAVHYFLCFWEISPSSL